MDAFTEGQEAIWTGLVRQFEHRVRIVAVRREYLVILGERPEDGRIVYDIADPAIKGTVFGIPGEQLEAVS
jgi:hypothetical protein